MVLNWRDTLMELIAEPTISSDDPSLDCGNRHGIEQLADRLETAGFCCHIQDIPGRDNKVNLIAQLGPKACRRDAGLVFAGHIDTVPYDEAEWNSNPFHLNERHDRLYGLGTTDMKGFIALAAGVASEYADTSLEAPLSLVVTAEEECGMDGARALVDNQIKLGRYCIIGEPTAMKPIRQHKGMLSETIRIHGKTGHSSNPAHGLNAIESMHQVVQVLLEWRDELAAASTQSAFPVPFTTLNLGTVHGGNAPNRIPAQCRLDIDMRFLPGFSEEKLRSILRERVTKALDDSDCTVQCSRLFAGSPAMETPANSPIVTTCEALTGHAAAAVDFSTEGAFYNLAGMESIVLGPGDIEMAHRPNEYLRLDRVTPTQTLLRTLVEKFCLPAK